MTAFSDPEVARKILTTYNRFAVVGCSDDPSRPSFRVTRYLLDHGYEVIPINPNHSVCQGLTCYPELAAAPGQIDVVDIFRRSEHVAAHVDEAIQAGAKAVWMQLGVVDEEAAQRAADAGLDVVMDRCPAIEHPRLVGGTPPPVL